MRLIVWGLLLLLPASAGAYPTIGIYTDPNMGPISDAIRCTNIAPGQSRTLYIAATLDFLTLEGITAAEFRIDNWLDQFEPGVLLDITCHGDICLGELEHDFSLMWSTPQGVDWGHVLIATVVVTLVEPGAIPNDHWMRVSEGLDCLCRVVIDSEVDVHFAGGEDFVINCDQYCGICVVATEQESWSTLKALY